MIVRRGELRDAAAVVALARESWPETPFAHAQVPDDGQLAASVAVWIDTPDAAGFVLVDDTDMPRGVFAVSAFEHPLSRQRLAGVLMWWVTPSARGHGLKLIKAAEDWTRGKGVDELHLYAHTPELDRLCALSGYTKLETTFRKVL